MKPKNNYILLMLALVLCTLGASSCSDQFDTINGSVVTNDDLRDLEQSNPDKLIEIVNPLMQGVYNTLNSVSDHDDFGLTSMFIRSDLGGDEMAMHTESWFLYDYLFDYYNEAYVRTYQHWSFFYTIIANCNDIMGKISADTDNTELRAILGQAHAMRAFSLFYLAQQYQQTYVGNEDKAMGPIPIMAEEGESILRRASLRETYAQIDKDFLAALDLLDGWERDNKMKVDKSVVALLYARVCLVKNDWDNAIKYAVEARGSKTTMTLAEVRNEGFNNITSTEWMWGADITSETSSAYASFFSHMCSYDGGYGGDVGCYKKIDKSLYNNMTSSDVRRIWFKGPSGSYSGKEATFPTYTNLKFKKVDNWLADYVFARVAETYLIEAEGYAQKGEQVQAANSLRPLMAQRDPSWNRTFVTVDEVWLQRRLELWGEGFALYDHLRLKKGINRSYSGTNHLSAAAFNLNAGSWYFLYQVPRRELDNNDYISDADQNPSPSEGEKQF